MAAAPVRRILRAPPPTPIATGKGTRSAAVDDRVLTEYLENSLKIPDLTLPEQYFLEKSPNRMVGPVKIDLHSLIARDEGSVRRMLAAAAEVGAFWTDGGDVVLGEDVRSMIEVGGGVFALPEGKRREVERYIGRGDGIGEEKFYWHRSMGAEIETVLEEALPGTYRIFREQMENVFSRLEMVADSIIEILSEHVRHQSHSTKIHKMHSILCLRKYDDSHNLRGDITKHHHSHSLSLHLSGDDHKFCIHSLKTSTSFTLPAGSILVTIGKQFQEWCNGELKSSTGEILLEPSDDRPAPFSLEFMYSPPVLSREPNHSFTKTVSIMDQLLIVLVLVFLYNLWY